MTGRQVYEGEGPYDTGIPDTEDAVRSAPQAVDDGGITKI